MATNYAPKFTGYPTSLPRGGSNHSTQSFRLGAVINDEQGNQYRYIKANEALSAGDVVTAVAAAAWDSGILVNGAVTSGNTIVVDNITTTVAASFYKDYWIFQAAAAGKGYSYRIVGHEPFTAGSSAEVYVEPAVGETLADNAALKIFNPWLVEKVDATTEMPRGVAATDIDSGNFGFVQIGGYVPAVKVGHSTSAAIVLNEPLVPVGSGNQGSMQGFAGTTEADILEAGLGRIIALDAVGANTTGFIPAYIIGQL